MIDVSPAQLQAIQDILKGIAPDCEARAFGSRFKWTAKDYSDLDLAIVGNEKLPFKKLSALKTAFEESDLPFRVDVLDWRAISPEFQKVIEGGYEVIQKRDEGSSYGISFDKIPSTWKVTTLGDIAQKDGYGLVDGPFGSNLPASDYISSGIPVIRGSNLSLGNKRFVADEFVFVSQQTAKRLERSTAKPDDIIFTKKGTLSQTGIVPHSLPYKQYLISSNQMKLSVDIEKVCPLFVYYYVSSPVSREKIIRDSEVTGVPKTNLAYLRTFPIALPPLPEQRAIAGILGGLDDKIELNRRMNRTLEATARAVYDDMVKVGYGEEKTIGDVVTIVGGSTPSTVNPAFWDDGAIHWATPKDLAPLDSPILLDTNSRISKLGLREISSGLLPIGTVLLSSRAPIGYLAITQIPVAINQGFIAIKCTDKVPNYFILNWLKENMEEIIGRANGTTFLEISKSNFRPMKIIVPPPQKMKLFVETVEPLYQKIVANLKESRTLASLRDSLLPKLMRGEVRVK